MTPTEALQHLASCADDLRKTLPTSAQRSSLIIDQQAVNALSEALKASEAKESSDGKLDD